MRNLLLVLFFTGIVSPAHAGLFSWFASKNQSNYSEMQAVHAHTLDRFEYDQGNPENERFIYYDSYEDVVGDCDDYVSAVYFELWKRGFEPLVYVYDEPDYGRHTIVCAQDYCFDNNRTHIFSERRFDYDIPTRWRVIDGAELNQFNMLELARLEQFYVDMDDVS